MTVRYTPQGCKVETTYIIQRNNSYTEEITLSVDSASALSLVIEESAGTPIGSRVPVRGSPRVRATRFGFELIPERS
jgi:hypothetical protein